MALTKPLLLAISVPTLTSSPLATQAVAGAPICIPKGIMTSLGRGAGTILTPALSLFSFGWIPPRLKVLNITSRLYWDYASAEVDSSLCSITSSRAGAALGATGTSAGSCLGAGTSTLLSD